MTESQLQSKCVAWMWNTHPQTRGLFFAVTNNSVNATKGAINRSMGVFPGVSDTIFLWQGKAYLIEFKAENGRQTQNQKDWQRSVEGQGFSYLIVDSFDCFTTLIEGIFSQEPPHPDRLHAAIEEITGVTLEQLQSKKRDGEIVEARQLAMWYRITVMRDKVKRVGKDYNRNHSTVIHSVKEIRNRIATNAFFAKVAENLINRLET